MHGSLSAIPTADCAFSAVQCESMYCSTMQCEHDAVQNYM